MSSDKTTTLWKLLKDKKVSIPKIQRDYAQGREGKEYIRRLFLKELKECLDEGKPLSLDFVYGNIEEDKYFPLDGQQRLTTLWLLHWYIALKANLLDNCRETLEKFSYEVRDTSRDFCKELCNRTIAPKDEERLSKYIKDQTWFYAAWIQDPTINAMLRTISGEKTEKQMIVLRVYLVGRIPKYIYHIGII
jgi:hypothetical protein